MLSSWTERPLDALLDAHDLVGVPEESFPNDGWSGATLTRLVRPHDGRPFILKRTSWATDWIARSTRDQALREGFIASMPLPLADPLVAPYYGAAADGTSVAILMPDLSGQLLAWEPRAGDAPITTGTVELVLRALARMHAMPWPITATPDVRLIWPSVPLRERLLLLSPRSSARLNADGVSAGSRFLEGWAAFRRLTSPGARDLVDALDQDPAPLLGALEALPVTGLHGDLKFANVALLDDGRVALIDWQMTALAPVAVELGWLLVSNSAALPVRPEFVLERYRRAVDAVAGLPVGVVMPFDRSLEFPRAALDGVLGGESEPRFRTIGRTLGNWDAQVDLSWIIGLLMRGWRKGLDAEAGTTLASGVTAVDDLAWWSERAVEAASRRL